MEVTVSTQPGELKALTEKARSEKKWLWCSYQDIWFSPDQLDAENAAGRYRWGAINWKLRDPAERVAEAKRRVDAATAEFQRIQAATPL